MAIALGGFSAVQLNDGFSDFSNFIYLIFTFLTVSSFFFVYLFILFEAKVTCHK